MRTLQGQGYESESQCAGRHSRTDGPVVFRYARELSMAAGTGLVCFEAFELAWLGFQPLEVMFVLVGLAVIVLAWHAEATQP